MSSVVSINFMCNLKFISVRGKNNVLIHHNCLTNLPVILKPSISLLSINFFFSLGLSPSRYSTAASHSLRYPRKSSSNHYNVLNPRKIQNNAFILTSVWYRSHVVPLIDLREPVNFWVVFLRFLYSSNHDAWCMMQPWKTPLLSPTNWQFLSTIQNSVLSISCDSKVQ